MLRPRIIPSLLIHEKGLVKSVKFKDFKYVGDPINAVRIFNEKASAAGQLKNTPRFGIDPALSDPVG